MSTSDPQLLHIYRKPISQKRVLGTDNYISIPRGHSPSSRKSVLISRRRHSTPQASSLRFVEFKSPQSNSAIKHYYGNTRLTRFQKEHNAKSDSFKSPRRPVTLVRPRHQDERVIRLPTTPTSLDSTTDIFLPIAKKNRTAIVDTPSPVASELHSTDRSISTKRQWNKREKAFCFDFGSDLCVSDEESSQDYTSSSNSTKCCKCCHRKLTCRLPCHHFCPCRCSCPFCCWILCFLLASGLLIGVFVFMGVSSP